MTDEQVIDLESENKLPISDVPRPEGVPVTIENVATYFSRNAPSFTTSFRINGKPFRVKFEDGRYQTMDEALIAAIDNELAKDGSAVARYVIKLDKVAAEKLVKEHQAELKAQKGGTHSMSMRQAPSAVSDTQQVLQQLEKAARDGGDTSLQLATSAEDLPPKLEEGAAPVGNALERAAANVEEHGGELLNPPDAKSNTPLKLNVG